MPAAPWITLGLLLSLATCPAGFAGSAEHLGFLAPVGQDPAPEALCIRGVCPGGMCAGTDGQCSQSHGKRLLEDCDFELAVRPLPGGSDKFAEGQVTLGSEGHLPHLELLSIAAGPDTLWNAVVMPDGKSVVLSTRNAWRTPGARVLDLDEHGVPQLAPLRQDSHAQWAMAEDTLGNVRLQHVRTKRYLAVNQGTSMLQDSSAAGRLSLGSEERLGSSTEFRLFPPIAARRLAEAGALSMDVLPRTSIAGKIPTWAWASTAVIGFIMAIMLIFPCWCLVHYQISSTSPQELQLRRGISRRDLSLLRDAVPNAQKAFRDYELKLRVWERRQEAAGKPRDPVPSLSDAEVMLANLEEELSRREAVAAAAAEAQQTREEEVRRRKREQEEDRLAAEQEQALRAAAEAAGKVSEGIERAFQARDLIALSEALDAARGVPGVDDHLLERGWELQHGLEVDARRMAALAALHAATQQRSITLLLAALHASEEAACAAEDELAQAKELLLKLEVDADSAEQGRGISPLLVTGLKQQDLELIERGARDSQREEVAAARRHASDLRARVQAQAKARDTLAEQLQAYAARRLQQAAPDARRGSWGSFFSSGGSADAEAAHVARAIDEWRRVGLSRAELLAVLKQWDGREQLHEVMPVRGCMVVRIKIREAVKEKVASSTANHPGQKAFVHALLPPEPASPLEQGVLREASSRCFRAQVPAGHQLYFGPARADRGAAEADLSKLLAAASAVAADMRAASLRKAQLDLHTPAAG